MQSRSESDAADSMPQAIRLAPLASVWVAESIFAKIGFMDV